MIRKVRVRKELLALFLIGIPLAFIYIPQMMRVRDNNPHPEIPSSNDEEQAPLTNNNLVFKHDVTTLEQQESVTCTRVNNVAFIKTHKAGSSTIANILQRYGIDYNLNFALPNKKVNSFGYNYIVRPGQTLTPNKLIALPPGQVYNILWSHSIYNRTAFHSIMPEDTAYFTILREPFQQFVSSFEYYGVVRAIKKLVPTIVNDTNPISTFLRMKRVTKLFSKTGHYGYVMNKQSQDLGFGESEFSDISKRMNYIKAIEKDFSFVMIMEHFDESLLILRHKLCWDMKDILYIPKNTNDRKPTRTYTSDDHQSHQNFSAVDYSLYEHFLNIYNEIIAQQTEDFFQELAHFKSLLVQVKANCIARHPFSVPESRWHKPFDVTTQDCRHMVMKELNGLQRLLARMNGTVISH